MPLHKLQLAPARMTDAFQHKADKRQRLLLRRLTSRRILRLPLDIRHFCQYAYAI